MATFKKRVETFWNWYSKNAAKFYAKIEDGKCEELLDPIRNACNKCLPGFAWVFGPGANGEGHSFTITGEGDFGLLFLASYWREQAPEIEGWTFYSSRQASEISGTEMISIAGTDFGPADLLVKPVIHEEDEQVGLDFWHPAFATGDQDLMYTVLSLWLDECLGEIDAMSWVSSAECVDLTGNADAFPITKLKAYLSLLQKERGWEKLPPEETYTLYQIPEPSDAFPRADTISGSTCNMQLIGSFLQSEGRMEDPLDGTGASFVYIGINRERFPEGQEVDFRADIEEAIDEALKTNQSGRVFGGAFGFQSGYIDLVIYDGDNSIALIKQVLSAKGLDDDYFIRPFANPA